MKKNISLLFLLCFLFSIAWSQTRQVKGKVTDEKGSPIGGVSVIPKGSSNGAQTSADGSFALNVTADRTELTFSYTGYTSKTMSASAGSSITVQLASTNSNLDEVVVVGYQPVRRRDLMAAASNVTAKEIKDNPLNNAAEVLQGRLAGVNITLSEGAPGAEATINIRGRNSITGSSEPLYVVDGVQVDNALTFLNPQDIADITVLKDAASTAIYGSRGANGVVVITTKGGRNTGGKTILAYNAYVGVQKLSKKLPMMGPYDFVVYQYERAYWNGDTGTSSNVRKYVSPYNFDSISAYKNSPGVDWQEETMGKNALQYSHNVSLSGGNDRTTYNLSLTANKQEGVLPNSDLTRKILNFRFDQKASDWLRFGFNTRYNDQQINGAGTSDAGGAGSNRLRQYTRYRPVLLPGQNVDSYDYDLDINNAGNGFNLLNPLLLADAEYRNRYNTVFNVNAYAQLNFGKYVSFRTTASYEINATRNRTYDDTLTNLAKSYNRQPVLSENSSRRVVLYNSNVLTYSNPSLFKSKNAISILAGQETRNNTIYFNAMQLLYFPIGTTPDRAFANLQLAPTSATGFTQPKPTSSVVPDNIVSFFTSADYNYAGKYFAKFNFRADGSSIFSPQNAWGYFPSGSLAWRVSREEFFKSRTITDLRARFSVGTSGNNRITPFSYLQLFSSPGNTGYGLNNALNGVFTPAGLGNENLIWESQISQNLGFDVELLRRFNITLDFYNNQSKNLLLVQTIPSSTGYTSQIQNVGATTNKGIELQVTAPIIRNKDFNWTANFNISTNKNRITSLGANQTILRNSGWFSSGNFPADYILKVGEEVGTMYGYINEGYYTLADFNNAPFSNATYPGYTTQYTLRPKTVSAAGILANPLQPGSPKFRDINGDGIINADSDRVVIGHAQPKFIGGLLQSFAYKNFDISVFVNYKIGGDVFNANKLEYTNAYGSELNMLTAVNGRWKVIDNRGRSTQRVISVNGVSTIVGLDSATIAQTNANASLWFPSTSVNGFYSQSYAIENGSYLRINNITLGYNFPKNMLSKAKITGLRLYGTVNNVATITGYSGYDPDANARRSDATTVGVDYAAYPRARTFVLGLNVTF